MDRVLQLGDERRAGIHNFHPFGLGAVGPRVALSQIHHLILGVKVESAVKLQMIRAVLRLWNTRLEGAKAGKTPNVGKRKVRSLCLTNRSFFTPKCALFAGFGRSLGARTSRIVGGEEGARAVRRAKLKGDERGVFEKSVSKRRHGLFGDHPEANEGARAE